MLREKRNALTVIFLGSMFAASLWRIGITIWLLSSPHRVEGCFRLEIAFFIFRWQLSHFLQKARIGIEIWDPFFVLLSISIMLWSCTIILCQIFEVSHCFPLDPVSGGIPPSVCSTRDTSKTDKASVFLLF